MSYAQVLRDARNTVDFRLAGVSRVRRTLEGHLLEVGEEDCKSKADLLASKLREALSERVRVARPSRNVKILVSGLDEFIAEDDLCKKFMAEFGGGSGVKVVSLRRSQSVGGVALVCCPAEEAAKAIKVDKLPVGWVMAKMRALRSRPLQCYRCFQPGHCRALCSSQVDRSDFCYRCGRPGHRAAGCTEDEGCPLCEESGRKFFHRMGKARCLAIGQRTSGPVSKP
ncbi:uncharacterized protein LOC109860996 [Pseudomyrmex gracilis]|uniref:uncharacterized protein LOC109860996 n=1 Tax=Pseudomyrmex gracilis TaxID=219809 RepID=UPI000994D748|nr:uncharacterized protein LOC109860996 [Pseudomyrmex gracilis]